MNENWSFQAVIKHSNKTNMRFSRFRKWLAWLCLRWVKENKAGADNGGSETRKEVYTLYNREGISQALLASIRNQFWKTSRKEFIGKISGGPESVLRLENQVWKHQKARWPPQAKKQEPVEWSWSRSEHMLGWMNTQLCLIFLSHC